LHDLEIEEELSSLSYDQHVLRSSLRSDLLHIFEEEELYWFKRSHETWLHKGDNNTDYFHRIANGRRRRSTIISLTDGDQEIVGTPQLLEHATNYYKSLFGPASSSTISLSSGLWDDAPKISSEDNDFLCRPFSEEEIKYVIFQMEHNKAAGPDAIPIEFFQTYWEIIKVDIMEMFEDFHKGKLDVSRFNYGIITLLPKISDASRIQQFRPICLLNCIYKWITKVLTIRLSPYAEKLICKEHTAFMKGRNIMNGMMVCMKCFMRQRGKRTLGWS